MRRAALPAAALLLLLAAAGCGGGGGGGGAGGGGGGQASVVDSITPADGSTGVDPATTITLRFLTPMDDAMLEGGALVLSPAGTSSPVTVAVDVASSLMSVTVDPLSALQPGVTYQVRLLPQARRAGGREIGRPWFSEFTTGGAPPPPPPPPPSQAANLLPVGSLHVGRSGHAAAALPDGRVAVFGGYSTSSTVTNSIEVLDPALGTWRNAAAVLGVARARLSATVLADGSVLLAGGEDGSASDVGLDRWEIWDPSTDAIAASGAMVERRTRHRAVLLGNGRVLCVGGSRTDTSGGSNFSRTTTEIFDPTLPGWSAGPSMAVPRAGHEATPLADGRVLVTGGHGSNALSEVFDPGTGSFGGAGTMFSARRDHAAVLLEDGGVLLEGGGNETSERWIPGENRWVRVQDMGDELSLHTAVRIANGRVFVAGGEKPGPGGSTVLHNLTEFYLPPTGTFLVPTLRLSVPRSGHTVTLLPGGDALLVGGKSSVLGGPALASCDRVTFF